MLISEPLKATSKTIDPTNHLQLEVVKRHLRDGGLLASFKLDGIRAVGQGSLKSRSMKPIPNKFAQEKFSNFPPLDGELIYGDPTAPDCYRTTNSVVMSRSDERGKDLRWFVFDYPERMPFKVRLGMLATEVKKAKNSGIVILDQKLCTSWDDVLAYEQIALDAGYEGLILRRPDGPYKMGRATLKEGYALKFKRFLDSEAVVIGMVELMRNHNPAELSETGHTKRAKLKENMIGGGLMGALQVRDIHTGVEFELGTGFTDQDKWNWWSYGKSAIGRIVKYKYFPVGVKEKPRHPVFLGERSREDMG